MMLRRWLHLLLAGLWFAGAQLGVLFLLQTKYSATMTSFLLTTSAWLTGSLLGVWIVDSRLAPWLWVLSSSAMASLSEIWSGVPSVWARGDITWGLVLISSLVAGQIFTHHFSLGAQMSRVFFVEALSFTVGALVSTVLLMFYGLKFLSALPLVALVLAGISVRLESRGDHALC